MHDSTPSPVPPHLIYQYCGPEGGLCVLNDLKLKVTPPIQFNDPFEFMPRMDHTMDQATLSKWLLNEELIAQAVAVGGPPPAGLGTIQELIRNHPDLMHQLFLLGYPETCRRFARESCQKFSEDFGVICFSRVRTNILMWSHYAAKHAGIVIGFDSLPVSPQLIDVDYSPERIRFDPTQPIGGVYDEAFARQIISTKHKDWRYEEEVRLIVKLSGVDPPIEATNGERLYLMRIRPELIKTISLGICCSGKTKARVLAAIEKNNLGVTVERAVPHDHNFEVSFKPLESNA